MSGPAFGVELPDNLGQAPEAAETSPEGSSAPNTEAASPSGQQVSDTQTKETIQDVLDLNKVEKFRFKDKEWNPKDLENSILMREDYTRKTMELAQARKYAENFQADARTVLADPNRLADFKKAGYPDFYVKQVEEILALRGHTQKAQGDQPQGNSKPDPEVEKMKQRFQEWDQAQKQAENQKLLAWLDNTYDTLSKKYPYANQEVVTARAEVMAASGIEVSESVLDKLFKQVNDQVKESWDKIYRSKVDKQLEVNSKGKDVGTGGGTPGRAPRGHKTLKEAEAAMLADFGAR